MGVDARTATRVVGVVVAWNRRDLLAQTLSGLAAQTRGLDGLVVIDNASTDDSAALARAHPGVTEVVTLPHNTGGAGGFAAGIARAVATHDADLVWLMDDDTVPTPTALEALLDARAAYPGRVSVAASRADWRDGREHPMNRPRPRPGASRVLRGAAAMADAVPIRSASFVSILVDAAAVRRHGLPEADYFLWNDDFEYTARLLRDGVGLYVPASRVYHLTKVFGSSDADPGPRFVNEVRNKLWVFTRSDALGPADRVLYAGATALRWARMLARSPHRGPLLAWGREGLAAGVRAPRPTRQVLAGTPVAADVEQIERGAGRA
ncbi:MAG: glycosyltransferase [Propionibacteriaceae bacterium]|nr:glycosyltransferase [Propionibacteriaceae bacterium]